MNGLEQRLRGAGDYPFPETPAMRDAVVRRLPEEARRFPWRKAGLAVALAVVAVAVTAAVSPSARSAFRDWLDFIPGVRIERVEKLPPSRVMPAFDLGQPVSLDAAKRRARFEVSLPPGFGKPSQAYFDRDGAGGSVVTVRYGAHLVITEWRSREVLFHKLFQPGTNAVIVDVDGAQGLWVSGGDHTAFYLGGDGGEYARSGRLVGNVLLWERGGIGYRLEARVSRARALEVARSFEP